MIIKNYLLRESFKSQIAILFVLLVIFFCQKLLRILSAAVDGDTPVNLIFSLLYLGIPEMLQLILPLSLFLGILMAYGRLYSDSEMVAIYACGGSKKHLIYPVIILSIISAAFSLYNNNWLIPHSSSYENYILAEAKANPSLAGIMEGQFQQSNNNGVLYIGHIKKDTIHHIFISQPSTEKQQKPIIIVADNGHIYKDHQGNQYISLNKGTRYEGSVVDKDFRISRFENYQATMAHKDVNVETDNQDIDQASMIDLYKMQNNRQAIYELSWRLTLILCIPILAFIAIPLSVVNPRQGRVVSMLPAIVLYLIYFLLQNSFKSNGMNGKLDSLSYIWLVNLVYLIIAILVNSWDSVFMRRIKAKLRGNH